MADTYTILAVTPSQRLQGGTVVVETIEAVGITIPNEVSFQVSVDKVGDWRAELAAKAAAEAAELESVFSL